ncbi:MAG: Asp-tRNA(Asn)/Glu-tRNA(Gln) amidotransferase subunit GatA [Burkholderiaceae bacterium]
MRFSELHELRRALDSGMVSAEELAQDYLDALAAESYGAALAIDPDRSLAQARAAQQRLDSKAADDTSPLVGLPILHKDVIVTQGWPTTAGSKMLKGYRSPFDAELVARLLAEGMVCLGKANCDEFAMGSANLHSAYGVCRNPWDTSRIPGGSSGGSAAAVAAGLAPAATGTDTGGSIRQPAAMCGITGIKPTYGRVSRWGLVAYASSLDQAGPMARSAADCAWLLNAMAGHDPKDATSLARDPEDFGRFLQASLSDHSLSERPLLGIRLGLPRQYFGTGLSGPVRAAIDSALSELQRLGAECLEVDLPRTELSIPAYYVIAPAEASSNLSRFDGVRYGHRSPQSPDLQSLYRNSRAEGFGPEVRRRILVGTFVLSHGYYDAYYLQAQKVRRLIAQDFQTAFAQCDFIVGPVSPSLAWTIDAAGQEKDPLADYLADIYTLGASLAGLPAMSVPCGFGHASDGAGPLPVGLQIIGRQFSEARMLGLAHRYQQATDWHRRCPPPAAGRAPTALESGALSGPGALSGSGALADEAGLAARGAQ